MSSSYMLLPRALIYWAPIILQQLILTRIVSQGCNRVGGRLLRPLPGSSSFGDVWKGDSTMIRGNLLVRIGVICYKLCPVLRCRTALRDTF